MPDSDEDSSTKSYWPSVADLFLTLFIIAIAIVAVVFAALLPTSNLGDEKAIVQAVGSDMRHVREPLNELRGALKRAEITTGQAAQVVLNELRNSCHEASILISDLEKRLVPLLAYGDGGKQAAENLLRDNQALKGELQKLQSQLAKLTAYSGNSPQGFAAIVEQNAELKKRLEGLLRTDNKPPIIQIRENHDNKGDYRFESGSSSMNLKFIAGLAKNEFRQLAEMILERQSDGPNRVNTLEIIGHTDQVPLKNERGRGNLDAKLPDYLQSRVELASLNPGSNNDLGLLRALAVKQQWQHFIESHPHSEMLQRIRIRCYSAGQTIPPDDSLEDDNALSQPSSERQKLARRIEMRLTLIEPESQRKSK